MTSRWLFWGLAGTFLVQAPVVLSDGGVLRQADGSTAKITDLGNGIGIITDPHGGHSPTPLPVQPENVPGPRGIFPGTVTPFGTPTPPNHLTPPPVLPFNPNRPLSPPPSLPSPNAGTGSGRAGR